MDRKVCRALLFSLVVDPQDCWNVVLIELVQQLLMYESSQEECQAPANVELGLVEDKVRREGCGVLGLWLDDLLRHVNDWQLIEDEDLVQGSKSCGWECPHERPWWVLRKRMEEELEGSAGLDLSARYGCKVHPLVIPFNCRFKEWKEACKAVQVHDGTSEVMMKFTALGVVHDEAAHTAKKNGKASLSQTERKGTKVKKEEKTK